MNAILIVKTLTVGGVLATIVYVCAILASLNASI